MKKIGLLFILFTLLPALHIFSQEKSTKTEVYYFHNTRRCMTCNTVEKVTKESLKELYGDKIELKSLIFEDSKNKPIVTRYNVEGQSLIVVKGDRKVDITSFAFMNAVNRPERLKEKIRETIDNLN
jgi:hypothetical protein